LSYESLSLPTPIANKDKIRVLAFQKCFTEAGTAAGMGAASARGGDKGAPSRRLAEQLLW